MRRSDSLDTESIEDAAGFDEPLLLNGHNVKQKIKLYENLPEQVTEEVPFVDFRKKVHNMKGKQPSTVSRTLRYFNQTFFDPHNAFADQHPTAGEFEAERSNRHLHYQFHWKVKPSTTAYRGLVSGL
jgi:hypothetical protein